MVTAEDGPTAVRLSRDLQPRLMLLDYMMPGMDGKGVVHALKQDPGTPPPTVFVTANPEAVEDAAQLGVSQVLTKPFSTQDLLDAVERHMADLRRQAS